jgi:acetyl esterase/lipase
MKWLFPTIVCLLTFTTMTTAQPTTQPEHEEIPLYPNGAPGAMGDAPTDRPAIFPFLAKNGNGAAVLVTPGGGYGHLAVDHEGWQVARWLNDNGISAFVFRYRYSPYRHPVPLNDALRAMRLVRSRAKQWNLDPTRIGMLGFSAGGHLTSSVGTHFDFQTSAIDDIDKFSARPDFLVLVYPVISLTTEFTHQGSKTNLLGENPDPKLAELMSNDRQVTAKTPPTFLIHSTTDEGVPWQNSQLFFDACQKNGVKSKLVLFDRGAHGYGLGGGDPKLSTWPDQCIAWLKEIGMTK